MTYLAKEGALGEASTVLRTIDGFQGEMINSMSWKKPCPTHLSALENDSEIYDDISMMSNGHSIVFGQKMISLHTRNISEYDKRIPKFLYAWAKLWKFWKKETFQKEVDFHELQSCLEKYQL